MRNFDSTVAGCVLWCSQSWAPKVEDLRKLEVARRKMLRRMLGAKRGADEDWINWMKRTTAKAEEVADSYGVKDWVMAHARAKWNWAGHVARRPCSTWLWKVSAWHDSDWTAWARDAGGALRPSWRRWVKWEDPLRRCCATAGLASRTRAASDREPWLLSADDVVRWLSNQS